MRGTCVARGPMHDRGGMCGRGGMHGGSVHGRGWCVAGGGVWQGGLHGRGVCVRGGGMHDRKNGYCSGLYALYWEYILVTTVPVSITVADHMSLKIFFIEIAVLSVLHQTVV